MTDTTSTIGTSLREDGLPADAERPTLRGDCVPAVRQALAVMSWMLLRYKRRLRGHITSVVVRDHRVHVLYSRKAPGVRISWIGPHFSALINTFALTWLGGQPYDLREYANAGGAQVSGGRVRVLHDYEHNILCEDADAFERYVDTQPKE